MQSVAPSTSSSSTPCGTEADLARAAGRGAADAFAQLFQRHAQSMWRLAQAVTPDPQVSASSVSDGFVRVLRSVRRRQTNADEALRPLLLASTYRAALDMARRPEQAHRDAEATAQALRSGERTAEAALAMAAFRSLPERWRAAVWLREVEGFEPGEVAPVLGVSSTVSAQLTARGRRGLLGRFAQAGMEPPARLDNLLRPLAGDAPTSLKAATLAQWRKSIASDPAGRWLPAAGWMSDRAVRPLSIASAGVLALGLIGVGVLGQHTGILDGGAFSASGAPHGTNPGVNGGYSNTASAGGQFSSPLAGFLASAANYASTGGVPATSSGAGYSSSSPSSPLSSTAPPLIGGAGTGGTAAAPATSTPAPVPAATTIVTTPTRVAKLAPVGSLTPTAPSVGTSPSISLGPLPGSTTPAASVSVGSCTAINLFGVAVPVSCPAGTAPGSVLPAGSPSTAPSSTATPTTTVPPVTGAVGGL